MTTSSTISCLGPHKELDQKCTQHSVVEHIAAAPRVCAAPALHCGRAGLQHLLVCKACGGGTGPWSRVSALERLFVDCGERCAVRVHRERLSWNRTTLSCAPALTGTSCFVVSRSFPRDSQSCTTRVHSLLVVGLGSTHLPQRAERIWINQQMVF